MKKQVQILSILTLGLALSQTAAAQMSGTHAFMIGDYVEIGINEFGFEGAPLDDAIPTHYRGFSGSLGFVANPAADEWVEYNGDYYQPGSPENGFGVTYVNSDGDTVSFGNNASMLINEIEGEITDFYETADSVRVFWAGITPDSLQVNVRYDLQKDQHYYSTTISLINIGSETFTDVYYYRNLDCDVNQDILWGYSTLNHIESQSGMADDSVRVSGSQDNTWIAEMIFHAYGPEWRGFIGGFYNRNGEHLWNGIGVIVEEDYSWLSDASMGLSYSAGTILPGRAGSEEFSFATAFKRGIVFENGATDGLNEIPLTDFSIYPNPVVGTQLSIEIQGTFTYTLTDVKGSSVMTGLGNGLTNLDISALEKGVYFMQLNQADKTATTRVVVQ